MVLGLFMDNLSLAVIYVGIAEVLCEKLKVEKGEAFYTCMFMGVMWVDDIISIASPIAHAPCLILMGYMSNTLGITVTYGTWLALGIPFALLMLVVIMVSVLFWHPDTSKFVNYDVDAEKANMPKLDTKGKISAVVFILAVLMMLLPEVFNALGIFTAFATYWKTCGVIVVGILAVSILCVIQVDGKPVLDMPAALKSLPMGAIIFAGVVCVMSTPINSELTGIGTWLPNVLQPLVSGLNPYVIMIFLCVCALIMTNFLSNVVTMALFFNLGVALLSGTGVNMGMFAMLIGIMSSIACLTPSACAPMPLVFGPGHVTMKNSIRANLFFVVLALVATLCYIIPVAPLLIK
jgi:sodium-dependent dicarboxylate transporter 2/3/5